MWYSLKVTYSLESGWKLECPLPLPKREIVDSIKSIIMSNDRSPCLQSDVRSTTNEEGNMLTLRIQESSSNSNHKHSITVSPARDTVAALKNKVVAACRSSSNNSGGTDINSSNYYVRLIAAGRLLAPDQAVLQQFCLHDDQAIHAVITTPHHGGKKGAQAFLQQGIGQSLSRRALRATGVNEAGWVVNQTGEEEENDENDDEDEDDGILLMESETTIPDLESGQRRRIPLGFDRLRATVGLGRADIMAFRIYFNSQIDRWLQQQPPNSNVMHIEERDVLRRRRLQEEEWMAVQGPTSEFRLNLNLHANNSLRLPIGNENNNEVLLRSNMSSSVGTDRDFLWGFFLGFFVSSLLGYFVGFLVLVLIWLPTVPHKQKLGILTGYSFHLALGMLVGSNAYNNDDVVALD